MQTTRLAREWIKAYMYNEHQLENNQTSAQFIDANVSQQPKRQMAAQCPSNQHETTSL